MKVALVSGTWTEGKCGVGDYARQLSNALEHKGIQVDRIAMDDWSIFNAGRYRAALRQSAPDIVHVQYPSIGYKRSLLPATTGYLKLDCPTVITLHEFQIYRSYWRFVFAPIALKMAARVFSRTEELDRFAKSYPTRKGQDHIIPIGSNIPKADGVERRRSSVAYFGLFWPGKGLEDFITFAELAKKAGIDPASLSVIGAPVAGKEAFLDHIRSKAEEIGFALHIDLPASEVARQLAAHEFAYLPFPSGADERRGSMAAALVNGCTLVTRYGDATPDWIRQNSLQADTPEQAADLLFGQGVSEDSLKELRGRASQIADRFDWSTIAQKHVALYEDILRTRASG
ncbi:hypothetical protein [Roseibium sediminis]|uniref:hypothetical protein n=1 Tax=Roseibium sediminis TaxID=1775174 RepID=UPI00123E3FC7|nr:hypothetical protein [Roseibium sediminis]